MELSCLRGIERTCVNLSRWIGEWGVHEEMSIKEFAAVHLKCLHNSDILNVHRSCTEVTTGERDFTKIS